MNAHRRGALALLRPWLVVALVALIGSVDPQVGVWAAMGGALVVLNDSEH